MCRSAGLIQKRLAEKYDDGDLALSGINVRVSDRRSNGNGNRIRQQGSKRWQNGASSVAALVMARTMQQFATKYPDQDPELMAGAIEFEKRALAAIKAHQSELPMPEKKPAA
jgi:acetyl-CoA acetyltransferase